MGWVGASRSAWDPHKDREAFLALHTMADENCTIASRNLPLKEMWWFGEDERPRRFVRMSTAEAPKLKAANAADARSSVPL